MYLSTDGAHKIHEAALTVLEKSGIKIEHELGRKLLLENGSKEDKDERILIPSSLVEKALTKAPSTLTIYNRNGKPTLELGTDKVHFGSGSDALFNVSLETGQAEKSTLADVERNTQLVDKLDQYDFVMSTGLPCDIDPTLQYATIFAAMVRNTTKPLVVTCTCVEEIKKMYEISQIITNGADLPFWLVYVEPISPLKFDDTCVDRLLYCAEKSIPFAFAAGANCAGGAPVTPEGGVVQGTAESLAGLVLATLHSEKVRFVFGANTSSSDMRTGIVCYGAPEWAKTVAMYADLGRFYKLPTWGTAGCTDAKELDVQAGMEAYESILLALQSGVSLAHDVGYQVHGCQYDCRMLLLCNEMIKRAKQLLRPVELSAENLALDVIDEVSRGGGIYLTHQHTFNHFKDSLWLPPKYIFRGNVNDKGPTIAECLSKAVEKLLKRPHNGQLEPEKSSKIDGLLKQ